MKIHSLKIKNVKSFKDEIEVVFDEKYNILIGPNGGGKSNLIDIIVRVLRTYFIISYEIQYENQYRNIINFNSSRTELEKILGKYNEDNSKSYIEISFKSDENDYANMYEIKDNIELFKQVYEKYYKTPISNLDYFINVWEIECFKENKIVTYRIEDFNYPNDTSKEQSNYIIYLKYYELFLLLSKEIDGLELEPIFLFLSPFRKIKNTDIIVNLSEESFNSFQFKLNNCTSKNDTSLLKLATLYFAEKRRFFEITSENYKKKWQIDNDVIEVTKYLKRLGYEWELGLIDRNKNIYEIIIYDIKSKKEVLIEQMSTGEQELINYIFGLFSSNILTGLILIDEFEKHLHPSWQSLINDLFIELLSRFPLQFVFSTHSPVFINNTNVSNIIRIYKENNSSQIKYNNQKELGNLKDLFHIVKSHNNEKIFFTDKVVLVEGIIDRLFFSKLLSFYINYFKISDEISVIEVNGKNNFDKYKKFLSAFYIDSFIIADNDYLNEIGDDKIKLLFKTDYKKADKSLKDKKSSDGKSLIKCLENTLKDNNFEKLKCLLIYIKKRHIKLKKSLSCEEKKEIQDFIFEKYKENIFILSFGEIEDYLPDGFKQLDKMIKLLNEDAFYNWLLESQDDESSKEIDLIISKILNISMINRKEIFGSLLKKLNYNSSVKSDL